METLSETAVIRMPREQVNIFINMCPVQCLQNKKKSLESFILSVISQLLTNKEFPLRADKYIFITLLIIIAII